MFRKLESSAEVRAQIHNLNVWYVDYIYFICPLQFARSHMPPIIMNRASGRSWKNWLAVRVMVWPSTEKYYCEEVQFKRFCLPVKKRLPFYWVKQTPPPPPRLSVRFEVDGDILKVDGYRGWRLPHRWGVWGQLTSPAGYRVIAPLEVQGGETCGSKINLRFWHCQKLPSLREILTSSTSWKEQYY